MDNTIQNPPPLFQTQPSPPISPTPNPSLNPSPFSKASQWFRTHKKLSVIIFAVLVLFCSLLLFIFRNQILPDPEKLNQPAGPESFSPSLSSIFLTSKKSTFSASENIPVAITANSQQTPISAFDVVLEYDPQILTLNGVASEDLENFLYFTKSNNGLIRISAIQKPDSTASQIFSGTNLSSLNFTAKKPGKTSIKLISTPSSTNDSNLLGQDSKDILGIGKGLELTIN